jgi:hypothetical protein
MFALVFIFVVLPILLLCVLGLLTILGLVLCHGRDTKRAETKKENP